MNTIVKSLGLAAALLGVALLDRQDLLPALGDGAPGRATGVMTGMLVMALANVIPKQASPSRAGLAARRASGWALLLSGLGYSLACLWLPPAYANDTALVIMLTGTTYTSWRLLRCRLRA